MTKNETRELKENTKTAMKEKERKVMKRLLENWPILIIFLVFLAFALLDTSTAVEAPKVYDAVSEDYYVTFEIAGKRLCGESTIIAEDDESWIIQMGDKVYVVSKKSVMFE